MSEYTPPRKDGPKGLPLWVMTFADLMTLLMCFFVLILSFSELDILKYKQLAGSMAHAFGVQRDIEARDPPKGINIIAREFSPGQPTPTPLNVVQQKTTSDLRIHLEVGGHKTRPVPTPRRRDHDPKDSANMKPEQPADRQADQEIEQKAGQHADEQAGERARELPGQQLTQEEIRTLEELQQEKAEIERLREEIRAREEALREREPHLDDATAEEILAARAARERQRQQEENARKILSELEEQILSGAVDVEREGQKIIIRIREKASFASGSAEVVAGFKPVLWRLGEIIEGMEGRVVVAGHTDNIPINTPRFRSNWELSSGRAVSVVHELLWQTAMPLERFLVQGHGETVPVAPNDTAANRAQNRRVEIILSQGDDRESDREISQQGVGDRPRETAVPEMPDEVADTLQESVRAEDEAGAADAADAVPVVLEGEDRAAEPAVTGVEPPSIVTQDVATENTPADEVAPAPAATDAGAPATGVSAGAPRRPSATPGTGSGVSAGIVRQPAPPNPEQEAP